MRLLWILAAATTAWHAVAAQGSLQELSSVLPPCGLKCLAQEIPASTCAPTDQTCICTNTELNAQITTCVTQACTIRDQLTTKNVTATMCQAPVRDKTQIVSGAGVAGGVITFVVFCLRMASRLPRYGGQFATDDWIMLVVMVLVIILTAFSAEIANAGLGKDIWTLPFDNITQVLYLYFLDECLYICIVSLTKISILCFYLRIFPKKSFRIAVQVVIALNAMYLVAFIFASVFQCNPVNLAWLRWDGEHQGTCNNINAQGWASAAFNMFLDIVTMSLPLRELYNLSLSTRRKILVMFMFSLGFFVTIVSAIRLQSLVQFASTTNLTWDYVPMGYWSTIEIDVGVICACLPGARSLFIHLFPSVFPSTIAATKGSHTRSAASVSALEVNFTPRPKRSNSDFIPLVEVDHKARHDDRY